MQERLLEGLNDEQLEAVQHVEGPLLILAGAGSGKTRVLTRRAAWIIANGLARADEILCVTFTNKAAREMAERVEALLGSAGGGMPVRTFHSFGLQLIREGGLGVPPDPRSVVLDVPDQLSMAREVLKRLNIDPERFPPRLMLDQIESHKRQGRLPEDLDPGRSAWLGGPALAEIYKVYQDTLVEQRALDFGDLLLWPVVGMRKHDDVAARIRSRFRYLMVDEYQDTNRIQFDMMEQLAIDHRNLAVVGDDDQSIYAWRGADIANILGFEKSYPEAKVVRLQQNYRSSPVILDAAWAVVRHNTARREKRLWTERKAGDPVRYAALGDERSEAQWAVERVREELDRGTAPTEVALFYRTNAQSRLLEEVLRFRGIAYRVVGNTGFYDRREIRDVLAYLRLLHNPWDYVAFQRIVNVPRRGIGDTTVERVLAVARERQVPVLEAIQGALEADVGGRPGKALAEFSGLIARFRDRAESLGVARLAATLIAEAGYRDHLRAEGPEASQDRLDNLDELLAAMQQYEDRADAPSLAGYLDEVTLVQEANDDGQLAAVQLMTLHSAKGLEFDAVVFCGLEEGVVPHSRALESGDVEEERRLCYVGMTRAKHRLYLSRARMRRVFGSERSHAPSRFLREIPTELLRDESPAAAPGRFPFAAPPGGHGAAAARGGRGAAPVRRRSAAGAEGSATPSRPPADVPAMYQPGSRLRHPKFGVGIVRGVEHGSHGIKLRMEFHDGVKTILPTYVELQPVT